MKLISKVTADYDVKSNCYIVAIDCIDDVSGKELHRVYYISMDDALSYCKGSSSKTSRMYQGVLERAMDLFMWYEED